MVDPARLAALVQDVVRGLTAGAPPPPTLPYLGVDHPSGTGFHLLDALSTRGIFRKYELVLGLGIGLGASARWLATRLGCEVVGIAASAAEARAADALTRRARLASRVRVIPGDASRLPVRRAAFTHAWSVEALARVDDPGPALVSAHDAVRPGGTLAIQEVVRRRGDAPAIAGWRFRTVDDVVAAIGTSGFVEIEVRDVSGDAGEPSARVLAARDQLARRAAEDPDLASVVAERAALATGLADGRLGVVQLTARRP